jgi:hypothetical protein
MYVMSQGILLKVSFVDKIYLDNLILNSILVQVQMRFGLHLQRHIIPFIKYVIFFFCSRTAIWRMNTSKHMLGDQRRAVCISFSTSATVYQFLYVKPTRTLLLINDCAKLSDIIILCTH